MTRRLSDRKLFGLLLVMALLTLVSPGTSARAATAAPVTAFGSNPGNLSMYEYVPDERPAAPALVVALHGCTQTAADYFTGSGWRELADRYGFVLVLPEQKTANNANRCFNWFEDADIRRDQGEVLSVRQMVGHAMSAYGVDPARVFVTGLSAGGAMTAALLATYPDVFAAGSVVAGIPYGCARSLISAFSCMNPGSDRTPAQWAQQVRDAFPGYAGPHPRVAVWHGTADTTVTPANARESRDQWVGVHGLSTTPTSTDVLVGSTGDTSREVYADAAGRRLVEVYRVEGMAHGTPVDPGDTPAECGATGAYFLDSICSSYHTADFWGLVG
jgi:poly(hydroxyalkanoate) depolymerase family esterase